MLDETKDIPKYYNNLGNDIDLLTSNDMSVFSGESQKRGVNLDDLLNS